MEAWDMFISHALGDHIDNYKIDESITSTHTSVKMDTRLDDRIPTILLPHMLNFLLYMEVLD